MYTVLALTTVNALLIVAIVLLNMEPWRSRFGETTGLWQSCVFGIGDTTSVEAWSPWLLVIGGVPAAAAFALSFAGGIDRAVRVLVRTIALVLAVLVGAAVLLPTATCTTSIAGAVGMGAGRSSSG